MSAATQATGVQQTVGPVEVLLHLARRARHAVSSAELGFIAVNETHALAPYRQAALWLPENGVTALSGVVSPEANAPFVHWLDRIGTVLAASAPEVPIVISPDLLAPEDAAEWDDWLSAHALWLPMPLPAGSGGLLLSREEPWQVSEVQLLTEWCDMWLHAWQGKHRPGKADWFMRQLQRPRMSLASAGATAGESAAGVQPQSATELVRTVLQRLGGLPAEVWRSPAKRYATLALLCLFIPVRLTVLVPGELVPAQPAAIRAPLEGTVDRFFVTPNQVVKTGAPLFQLDLTSLNSKLDVARQGLATADAEYRQAAQQAVFDSRSKAQLSTLQGRIAERTADVEYLQAQLARAQVVAPRDGVALVDDPSEWIGKPVVTGERVMTIADEHDVEVEAWLAPADAIDMPDKTPVTLYLNSAPLAPVKAHLRYAAHEATPRPDGSFAYRVRAVLDADENRPRVGLKGTARVSGNYVPVIYWILRRPLAAIRPWLGL
jgi:multidrug efflux pump subunit AcrA (membrane-fusion protein)